MFTYLKEELSLNTNITSRQDILNTARSLARDMSLSLIGIRQVADACDISVGTVYNYFPSKADLLAALTEDIWRTAFDGHLDDADNLGFVDYVSWLFQRARSATSGFPSFLSRHPLHFRSMEKKEGRAVMENMFQYLKSSMRASLDRDKNAAITSLYTNINPDELVEFAFVNLYSLLASGSDNCDTLLKVLQLILYQ